MRTFDLLPFLNNESTCRLSLSLLKINPSQALDDQIVSLLKTEGECIPQNFECYVATNADGDECFGIRTTDHCGHPLRTLTSRQLAQLQLGKEIEESETLASWAYLRTLPQERRIAIVIG